MSKVDWDTAAQVARRFSGEYPLAGTYHERRFELQAPGLVARASDMVSDETGLELSGAPVVDDAAEWGRIAAANSLSDIYAMGGTPLAALNLLCWPETLSQDVLADVLRGGGEAAAKAKCLVVGGGRIGNRQCTNRVASGATATD